MGVLLVASLVPLALVGIGSFVVFSRLLVQRTLEQQRSEVQSQAAAIDLYLGERLRALELLARTHTRAELTAPGRMQELLQKLSASYPRDFADLGVIDGRRRSLAQAGSAQAGHRSYLDTEWFARTPSTGSFVSDVFSGQDQRPHWVLAVRRPDAEGFWILRATINGDCLFSMVRQAHRGRRVDAFIVNAAGVYQTPPAAGQVLQHWGRQRPLAHPGVQDSRVEGQHGPMLQVTTWINQGRWLLVVRQDEAEIQAPLRRAVARGVVVVSLAVGLVALVTLIATAHLTRRIERATAERDKVQGDLLRSGKLASLGELATGLAHEINNPLATILAEQTNIADQLEDLELPAEARAGLLDSVDRCRRQVDRCAAITNKMLRFGRKADSRPRPTPLGSLLEEVVELMHRRANLANVKLVLEIEEDLPAVVVDGTELEQVLVNLIKNSMESIPARGLIRLSARRAGAEVQLAVADTGTGIAPEHLDRVFQPFFTTKPFSQGTGMGLAVCYGLVRSWGGRISVDSTPGRGTTMTLHLPSASASASRRSGSPP